MDDEIEKDAPNIQADNQSIAIGEINILGNVTGNITIGHTIVQPADARLRHELGILLKNVQTTWIKGVLEKSVHDAALLELGLELRAEAVDNPWRMVMEAPDQSRETLPRGRRIKDIFDEANRLLLVLGEPGSGKTTTLLQLARDLIAEVDLSTFTQPVPVILNLSTWTNKAQPLDKWLVAELNSKYRLPKKDGQRWLKERRILPLLDGLDEVRAENRAACVEKINQLVTDYGLQGLVVCSRFKEYTALNVRLGFYRAIYIQPLTFEQVDEYLERAGDRLASLRETLQADEALRSMAQSPLILNVMSLAYQNASAEALSNPKLNTDKARRKHLFDTYIARMFNRKARGQQYDNEETRQRLSWLARNMQKHNQYVFLIEGLQPSWLQTRSWRCVYTLASRLLSGLIFGLSFGLVYGLMDRLNAGLIYGLLVGLPVSIIDVLRFEWLDKWRDRKEITDFWWSVINIASVGFIIGLIYGLVYGLIYGLLVGLIGGLIFGIRGSRKNLKNDIQTVEALQWYWGKALKGGLIGGLSFGLIGALGFGPYVGLGYIRLISRLKFGLIGGLIGGLSFGLIGGLSGAVFYGLNPKIIETKTTPNQGIRLSARNALFGGLIGGLSVGPIVGLSFGLILGMIYELIFRDSGWQSDGLLVGLFTGVLGGLLAGSAGALWYGGLDVIQHYTLRIILMIQGHTSRNYARFLDYAVDRIFLQKVGGGYRFIHRLLLEHFAEMGEVKKV